MDQRYNKGHDMKKVLGFVFIIVFGLSVMGASTRVKGVFLPTHTATTVLQNTYANSTSDTSTVRQIDTLRYLRPSGVTALTFSVEFGDSAKFINVVVRRIFGNTVAAAVAGDTIIAGAALTAAGVRYGNITLAPYCDAYDIYVQYDTTANGVTSPSVVYRMHQQVGF